MSMRADSVTDTTSFQKFLQLCDAQGLSSKPDGLADNDIPDGLRFFNGRGGDIDGALQQFKESTEIRKSIRDIETYENIDVEDYEAMRHLYPHWTGRRDKRGLPICMFDIAALNHTRMAAYKKMRAATTTVPASSSAEKTNTSAAASATASSNLNSTQGAVAFHDTLTRFILPLCSAMSDRQNNRTVPVSSAVYLVDVSSFGLKQALELRNYAQDISKLLATCYPEVVDTVFVLNAPSYFSKIWSFLKKWIDPRTASKLVILSPNEVLPTLRESIGVQDIPMQLGGELEFSHGSMPVLDRGIVELLDWGTREGGGIPKGPVKWVEVKGGERVAMAVGREGGKVRRELVARMRPHSYT